VLNCKRAMMTFKMLDASQNTDRNTKYICDRLAQNRTVSSHKIVTEVTKRLCCRKLEIFDASTHLDCTANKCRPDIPLGAERPSSYYQLSG